MDFTQESTLKAQKKDQNQSLQQISMQFVKSNSEHDYKVLVNRLRPGLWRHVSKIEHDFDTRNFILTTTFAKMWTEINKYDENIASFSSWIYRIAWNEALQQKRYSNRHTSYDELYENGSKSLHSSSDIIFQNEFFDEDIEYDPIDLLYKIVVDIIINMDKGQDKKCIYGDILKMRMLKKMKYSKISEVLGIPINTAKARVFNGKKKLKKIIEDKYPSYINDFKKYVNIN